MEQKKHRNLKVYETSVAPSSNTSFYSRSGGYKSVPQIPMQGKWLEELDFGAGTPISVECENGRLIITKN